MVINEFTQLFEIHESEALDASKTKPDQSDLDSFNKDEKGNESHF